MKKIKLSSVFHLEKVKVKIIKIRREHKSVIQMPGLGTLSHREYMNVLFGMVEYLIWSCLLADNNLNVNEMYL